MIYYSQRDIRWRYLRLGSSKSTIGNYGCAITCLAMLSGRAPSEINMLLLRNSGFLAGNLVIWARACALLGLSWRGQSSAPQFLPTIAQVRGAGFSCHFVVWLGNNKIIDPWDGKLKINPYLVVKFDNCKSKFVQ